MLSFNNVRFWREPYLFGVAHQVLGRHVYAEMVEQFPDVSMFATFGGGNIKRSLSEVNNPEFYEAAVMASDVWRKFHKYVKTQMISELIQVLTAQGVVLSGKFKSRFEFSALPANGGCLRPHTDIPSKVVTLVIPIVNEPWDWMPEWGGGTDMLMPKDGAKPLQDYKAEFEEFDKAHVVEFAPNQALVFIKSDKSWHCVSPINGPEGVWRKSLTVNIERAK